MPQIKRHFKKATYPETFCFRNLEISLSPPFLPPGQLSLVQQPSNRISRSQFFLSASHSGSASASTLSTSYYQDLPLASVVPFSQTYRDGSSFSRN